MLAASEAFTGTHFIEDLYSGGSPEKILLFIFSKLDKSYYNPRLSPDNFEDFCLGGGLKIEDSVILLLIFGGVFGTSS